MIQILKEKLFALLTTGYADYDKIARDTASLEATRKAFQEHGFEFY